MDFSRTISLSCELIVTSTVPGGEQCVVHARYLHDRQIICRSRMVHSIYTQFKIYLSDYRDHYH